MILQKTAGFCAEQRLTEIAQDVGFVQVNETFPVLYEKRTQGDLTQNEKLGNNDGQTAGSRFFRI